jgi:hypothetical protein
MASSENVLRSEVEVLLVVSALLGEVDVPIASCLERAVALALPPREGLARLAVVEGDEGTECFGG